MTDCAHRSDLRLASRHARSRNLALVDRRHRHSARLRRPGPLIALYLKTVTAKKYEPGASQAPARIGRPLTQCRSAERMIADLLRRSTFPPPGTRVTCGLSGGADSTALVRLAVAAGCEVTAIHVDHGLRPSAVDDQRCARTDCGAARHRVPGRAHRPRRRAEPRGASPGRPPTGARPRCAHGPHGRRPGRDAAARVAAWLGSERPGGDGARADPTDPRPPASRDRCAVRGGGAPVRARSVERRSAVPAQPRPPRAPAA